MTKNAKIAQIKKHADAFNCMPVAAVVEDKILCMHGGLSPDLDHLSQVFDIPRPTDVPDEGLLCDLLWSDPEADISGWAENDRGVSYTFGADVVSKRMRVACTVRVRIGRVNTLSGLAHRACLPCRDHLGA